MICKLVRINQDIIQHFSNGDFLFYENGMALQYAITAFKDGNIVYKHCATFPDGLCRPTGPASKEEWERIRDLQKQLNR